MANILRSWFKRPAQRLPTIEAPPCSKEGPLEEENAPQSDISAYYPVRLGEVLRGRYQLTAKLGCGARSTVWLARDLRRWKWQAERFVAIKISVVQNLAKDMEEVELWAMRRITAADPDHCGYGFVPILLDSFHIKSKAGKHLCLATEVFREDINLASTAFEDDILPLPLVKVITTIILEALDYLHVKCHIIHTDISQANILLRFKEKGAHEILEDIAQEAWTDPLPVKHLADRTIYLTHTDFGDMAQGVGGCVLADYDACVEATDEPTHNHNIGPTAHAAPEVLLRAKWHYSVDIWNFAVLVCGMLEGKLIFDAEDRKHWSEFSEHLSFARMIAFLGPPPAALLDRAERLGEFYTDDKVFKYPELIPHGLSFETFFTRIEGEEKEKALSFLRRALKWLPEERPTAEQLLEDEWVNGMRKSIGK